MSDAAIFAIGGVLFIFTTWATIVFLMSKIIGQQRQDVLSSPGVSAMASDTFTEVRVSAPNSDS